ncbi:MAG: serine hydrolase [Bacteroidota bacterium]|nr:serine hydrolase [Bacteroidota bacterium]
MIKFAAVTLLILGTFAAVTTAKPKQRRMSLHDLKTKVDSIFKTGEGTFALAFKDLKTGKSLLLNARMVFHAASTMKTPVMIEVFRQASKKKFSIEDSLEVRNNFKSIVDGSSYALNSTDDSDDSAYSFVGKKLTIRDLIEAMITQSSNLATNILIDKVGAKNVMRTMRALGARNIQVLRGVEDEKAFEAGMNNTTTTLDLAIIYEKLARGQVVSKKASEVMCDVLLHQKFNEKIPRYLPHNVKVAHKTGNISGVEHDSGIVYLPDGRKYVLVILSENLKDKAKGVEAIARASKAVYDYEVQS